MEKSIKRAWKVSSALMILLITTSLLSTRVFLTNSVADQLDQYQTTLSHRAWHHIHENKYWAQSFKAGLSGDLTKVTLYLKSEGAPQPLVIELRNCVTQQEKGEDYYAPGDTILASVESSNVTSTTGQEYSFTFSTAVSSGTSYTIVLYQKNNGGGKHDKYYWSENQDNQYTRGNNSKSDDGGTTWKRGGGDGTHDQYFKTYVAVSSALTVTNSTGASNVTTTAARLNGEVTSTGGENPTVHIYWGDNDGGTTSGNWDHDENLGTKGTVTFYKNISNLTPNTTYYYRCYATNSGGSDWANSSASFTTSVSTPTGGISMNADSINILADGKATSTITATVKDQYGDNVPDGTNVTFTTDHGTLGSSTVTKQTSGGVATATLTSESSTETVIATVTATANGASGATTVFFIPEGGTEVEEVESKDVSGTGGTIPSGESPTGGEVTVSGSSIPEGTVLTVAKYKNNPVDTPIFKASGDYWDTYLNNDTGVTSVTINFSPADPGDTIYYWDSPIWYFCSDQAYSNGSVVITVTDSTTPDLSDLSGLVLAKDLGAIVINDDATFANSRSVSLTLSATGATQMQFSNDASSWSDWEGYSTSKSWTLSSGDGTKTVYVRFKDTAGNISKAFSDDIIFETTPPTGSISIDNGATYTDSGSVTLSLSASDNLSEVSQMMISNSSSFEGASWEDYITEKSWTLPSGDGGKKVYVKFKDGAGNVSGIYSDEIILDTAPPTASITFPSADTSVRGSVVIKGTASDENFKEYRVEYGQGTEPSGWTEITSSTSQVTDDTLATWDTTALNDGSYTLRLTAQDLAGNSGQTQLSLRVDNHPPETTLIGYPTDTVTGNTPKVDVNFTWTGSDPDNITPVEKLVYQYKLEGHLDYQNWSDWTQETTKTYMLSSGNYTFKVRAKDEAGNYPEENESATAKSSFTVSLPIIIYPNPCYLNQGQPVTIANLPLTSDVKIYIYDLGGNLIRTLGESEARIEGGSKTATWDCRNGNGEVVTRDIYVYFIPGATEKKTGKIAIIR